MPITTKDPSVTFQPGCLLDGAYGWHNTYRLIDFAVAYGFTVDAETAEILNHYRANKIEVHTEYEVVYDLYEMAEQWLDDFMLDGVVEHEDGVYLVQYGACPECGEKYPVDPETGEVECDCDPRTAAAWPPNSGGPVVPDSVR